MLYLLSENGNLSFGRSLAIINAETMTTVISKTMPYYHYFCLKDALKEHIPKKFVGIEIPKMPLGTGTPTMLMG